MSAGETEPTCARYTPFVKNLCQAFPVKCSVMPPVPDPPTAHASPAAGTVTLSTAL